MKGMRGCYETGRECERKGSLACSVILGSWDARRTMRQRAPARAIAGPRRLGPLHAMAPAGGRENISLSSLSKRSLIPEGEKGDTRNIYALSLFPYPFG